MMMPLACSMTARLAIASCICWARVAVLSYFPADVALPSTYINDVCFDLRRGEAGVAYITDSSDSGPDGIIVVDLASGQSWRRLHEHPSTKAEPLQAFQPVVEGRPFLQRPADGDPTPVVMGCDGIAIAADGSRLYYCPLASRRWYSVAADALTDQRLGDDEVAATVIDEGDKGGGSDGLETDDTGRLYLSSYEHNAVLRRRADGEYETVVHDSRPLWPNTMSVGRRRVPLYVTADQLHRQAAYQRDRTCGASRTFCSGPGSTRARSCCAEPVAIPRPVDHSRRR
ncbi:L-dopachrome tautomerase-related protein [Micromonospora sp. NPDC000442]|uniref:L-dopachrome tautomerase-related protein n=1 Tax=Micromonospora sp. NPDC000442 TaxID=3364217 RepID=UPI0036C27046